MESRRRTGSTSSEGHRPLLQDFENEFPSNVEDTLSQAKNDAKQSVEQNEKNISFEELILRFNCEYINVSDNETQPTELDDYLKLMTHNNAAYIKTKSGFHYVAKKALVKTRDDDDKEQITIEAIKRDLPEAHTSNLDDLFTSVTTGSLVSQSTLNQIVNLGIHDHYKELLPTFKNEFLWTWSRFIAQAICVAAPAIEPFFAMFLYTGIISIFENIAKEYSFLSEYEAIAYMLPVLIFLANASSFIFSFGFNLGADMFSVDPIDEAEAALEVIESLTKKESPYEKKKAADDKRAHERELRADDNAKKYWIDPVTVEKIGNGLKTITIAVATSGFITLALADAVGMLGPDSPLHLPESIKNNIFVKIPVSVFFSAEGLTYYLMFTGANIKRHTAKYADRFFRVDFNVLKEALATSNLPTTTLAGLRILFNILYRTASTMLITQEVLTLFGLHHTHPAFKPLLYAMGASTAYVTANSRALQVTNRFFNPDFNVLTPDDLKNNKVKVGVTNTIVDIGLSGLTATTAGYVTYSLLERVAECSTTFSLVAGGAVTLAAFVEQFFVLRNTQLKESALKLERVTSTLAEQKQNDEAYIKKNKINITSNEDIAAKIFGKIAQQLLEASPKIEKFIKGLNAGAGIARGIAFNGFFFKLLSTFKDNPFIASLTFEEKTAMATLIATFYLSGDRAVFKDAIEEFISRLLAKHEIGNRTTVQSNSTDNVFSKAHNGLLVWRTAGSKYEPELLVKAYQNMQTTFDEQKKVAASNRA